MGFFFPFFRPRNYTEHASTTFENVGTTMAASNCPLRSATNDYMVHFEAILIITVMCNANGTS